MQVFNFLAYMTFFLILVAGCSNSEPRTTTVIITPDPPVPRPEDLFQDPVNDIRLTLFESEGDTVYRVKPDRMKELLTALNKQLYSVSVRGVEVMGSLDIVTAKTTTNWRVFFLENQRYGFLDNKRQLHLESMDAATFKEYFEADD